MKLNKQSSKRITANASMTLGSALKAKKTISQGLHRSNPMRNSYDLKLLSQTLPSLFPFITMNKHGQLSIDFTDPSAVKKLNQALLAHHYGINDWDIPQGFLCPPVPGRADYVHHLADLLADGKTTPTGQTVSILDVGTGANGIYPLVGNQSFGWRYVGTDIDPLSLDNFHRLISTNQLQDAISLRLQPQPTHIFKNIIKPGEMFHATMCNPPFHASLAEANAGTQKKLKNLAANKGRHHDSKLQRNFGGQKAELWCDGGELRFLQNMIRESQMFAEQCLWFTSLVSKAEHLRACRRSLKKMNAKTARIIEMHQGNKITRILAWSFVDDVQRTHWSAGI